MRPEVAAARALAAILPTLARPEETQPADARLRAFFREHPSIGKRERVLAADLVFDVLRNLRLYRVLATDDERAQDALPEHFTEAQANRLVAQAAAVRAGEVGQASLEQLPEPVRFSLPDWLWERLRAVHGDATGAIAAALLAPAPLDIRANLLRTKAATLRDELARRGVESVPVAGVPTALRLPGRPALERLDLFERGWFEIQDAGSQWIVDSCAPRRGQLVIDFCAGAGGKTLALAARMRNSGRILAFDTSAERLSRLGPRASRAGVDIVATMRLDGPDDPRLARYRGRADVVLVDAPCSGTGTLARSPELKWRLTPARLEALLLLQRRILASAARLARDDGTLVYATCSLLDEENRGQARWFDVGAGTRRASADERHRPPGSAASAVARTEDWLPDGRHSSGFFVAKWLTRPPA
jgi:16S rRNA (cytosine967-C5)-methyltransferase